LAIGYRLLAASPMEKDFLLPTSCHKPKVKNKKPETTIKQLNN
jgi:hypothetical protein